jgi:hypothetical protein
MADRARLGMDLPVKVPSKKWGTKSGRARPLAWRSAFLKVLERTGSKRRAAKAAGVSYSGAQKHISRNTWMRAECEVAEAKWLYRQILRGERRGTRLSLGRRRLASLVLLIRKGGVFE